MPRDDEKLKRLEQYLGRSLQIDEHPAMKRKPRHSPGRKASPSPALGGIRRASLEEAVPDGYAVRVAEHGYAYKVITPVHPARLPENFAAAFASEQTPLQQRLLDNCRMTAKLEDLLFVDLETTGLAQAPLFLIGAMSWEQDGLLIRQFLARNGDEEAAVIRSLLDLVAVKELLITFNGKSFDLPTLHQRAEATGVLCVIHARHFDLLHECRRVWRDQLPNCQLQTLETHICGHPPRDDQDIPGEQIPDAYRAFLRNGNALQIAQIIRHNAQDLLTMAELLARLPAFEE